MIALLLACVALAVGVVLGGALERRDREHADAASYVRGFRRGMWTAQEQQRAMRALERACGGDH